MVIEELSNLPHTYDWNGLYQYIAILKDEEPSLPIWKEIAEKPVDKKFLHELRSQEWKVRGEPMDLLADGLYDYENRVIRINNYLIMRMNDEKAYERDKFLFHEIAHLRFGLNDNIGNPGWKKNAAIAEWIGRQSRADPELLKHAVKGFGLEPIIYDLASYQAFHGRMKNFLFPSQSRQKNQYGKIGIMMD